MHKKKIQHKFHPFKSKWKALKKSIDFKKAIIGSLVFLISISAAIIEKLISKNLNTVLLTSSLLSLLLIFYNLILNPLLAFIDDMKNIVLIQNDNYLIVAKEIMCKSNRLIEENNYHWQQFNDEIFLTSDDVNCSLWNNIEKIKINVIKKIDKLPAESKHFLANFINEKLIEGKIIYNSKLVKLCDDMTIINEKNDEFTIDLKMTDYFSNICTNDVIAKKIKSKNKASFLIEGKIFSLDEKNMLYNLRNSLCANIIGSTTLAFTNDDKIIICLQGAKNDVNKHKYVPTGSGSADFNDLFSDKKSIWERRDKLKRKLKQIKRKKIQLKRDFAIKSHKITIEEKAEFFKAFYDLKAAKQKYKKEMKNLKFENYLEPFLIKAMERELTEELLLDNSFSVIKNSCSTIPAKLFTTKVISYVKLLKRGGKPDFFGITYINYDFKTIENNFKVNTESRFANMSSNINKASKKYYFSEIETAKIKAFNIQDIFNGNIFNLIKAEQMSIQLYTMLNSIRYFKENQNIDLFKEIKNLQ